MYQRLIILLLLLTCCHCGTVSAASLKRDNNLRVGKLSNGLTYYIYPNDRPKGEAVYRLFVKAGSVMEEEDERGLAHFLEHIAFNGTRHFPGDGIVRFLQSKGAKFGKDLNAHTAFNETVYKLQLPTTDASVVDSTMLILADWAGSMTISEEEVDKERGVILSEWRQRGTDKQTASKLLLDEMLNGSSYARRMPIGDTAVIKHAPASRLRRFYEKWYTPDRMAVAVAGDINPDNIEVLIKKYFSPLKASKSAKWKPVKIAPYQGLKITISTDTLTRDNTFEAITLCPLPKPVKTKEDYRQYLMRAMVNRLVKQRFNALSFFNPAYDKGSLQYAPLLGATGVVDASAQLQKDKIRQGILDFVAHCRQIAAYGFTTTEIRRVGKSLEKSLRLKAEGLSGLTSSQIMESIYADYYDGNTFISLQDEYKLMQGLLPQMDSVAVAKAVQAILKPAARHYLLTGTPHDITLSNDALKALLDEAYRKPLLPRYQTNDTIPDELCDIPYARHIVSEQDILALKAKDLRLDNGARVIFRHTDAEPDRITLSAFRKGGQYSIDSTLYATSLVAPPMVSLSGAGDFSRDALSAYLSGSTATAHLLVDKMRTGVSAQAHLADMETMFQLVWLRWAKPRIDENVFRLTMDKIIENAAQAKQPSPSEKFTKQVQRVLNGDRYTNRDITCGQWEQVRVDSIVPMMNHFYGPATGFTFIIHSAAPYEEVRPLIETYIGALPKGRPDTTWVLPARYQVPADTLVKGSSKDKNRATVTLLCMQYTDNTEYFERQIMEDMTQGILRQALLGKLREEMGKVYSVSVSLSSSPYPSFMQMATIAFVCNPVDVDMLVKAARDVTDDVIAQPMKYAEIMQDVKSNLLKDYHKKRQRSSYWTTWIRNAVYTGHEQWDKLLDYERMVNAVAPDRWAAFARQCFLTARKVTAIAE